MLLKAILGVKASLLDSISFRLEDESFSDEVKSSIETYFMKTVMGSFEDYALK